MTSIFPSIDRILSGAIGLILIGFFVMFTTMAEAGDSIPGKTKSLIENNNRNGSAPLPISKGKFMFSVTLHDPKKIDSLLTRAQELSKTMRANGNNSKIALILHGPEIKFFAKNNKNGISSLVDKAAKLDGDKIIEVKICKSRMDEFGIKDKDIPEFVEIIPYAPEEEQKLLDQGYVYL